MSRIMNKNNYKTLVCVVFLAFFSLTLSGCGKAISMGAPVPHHIEKEVSVDFKQRFSIGDWRFQGTHNANGTIKAHIQIPQKLALSSKQQTNYIRTNICPNEASLKIWYKLKGYDLEVNLYTIDKNHGFTAACQSPLA